MNSHSCSNCLFIFISMEFISRSEVLYIRSVVVSILIISSLVILYKCQMGSEPLGRQFVLDLSFQNIVNRAVPNSSYTVKLPYGFVVSPDDVEQIRIEGAGQLSAYFSFDNTPRYSGRSVTIKGVIPDVDLSGLVTSRDGCLELLNEDECLELATDLSDEAIGDIASSSYGNSADLMSIRNITQEQWRYLVGLYSFAKQRAEDGNDIRLVLGVDGMSKDYRPILRLEYRSSSNESWQSYGESASLSWLPVEVVPSLNISLEELALISGYGLSLVKSELSVASSQPPMK
jgi:hypothetical protein